MQEEIEKLKQTGNKLFSESKFEEAIEFYTKAIELSTNISEQSVKTKLAILHSNRANSFLNLNKNENALEDGDKAIILNPNWFKGYFRKAKALSGLGKLSEAKQNLKQAFKLAKTAEEKKEVKQNFTKLDLKNKQQLKINILEAINTENQSNKNFFSDTSEENFKSQEEDYLEDDLVQDQIDFLMSQFIKPYEEDAFRSLAVYHGVVDGRLKKESAQIWIKFAEEYGCGDSLELLEALIKYVELNDEKEIRREFEKIYQMSGIIV